MRSPRFLTVRPRLFNLAHALRLTPAFSATRLTELDRLERHAAGCKTAIEIGTFMGVAAARIAGAMAPTGMLHCVDPYEDVDAVLAVCKRHLKRSGVMHKVEIVRQSSRDATEGLPRHADFIFVDGDHSWDGIAMDWGIVNRCLMVGAIACFHDTSPPPEAPNERCGSVRFFEEVILADRRFQLIETCLTLNVVRRMS